MNIARLHAVDHPVAADRLRVLRDRTTGREQFAHALEQLAVILAVTASAGLETIPAPVATPLEEAPARRLARRILLVPILRAGLGFLRGFQEVLPEADVAFFGAARDEKTLQPAIYLDKIPPLTAETTIFVLDPMLATGRSACAALARLRERGAEAESITLVCCLAAPEGIAEVLRHYPKISIVTAAVDRQLNEVGFILPGLGDAGDRQFGG